MSVMSFVKMKLYCRNICLFLHNVWKICTKLSVPLWLCTCMTSDDNPFHCKNIKWWTSHAIHVNECMKMFNLIACSFEVTCVALGSLLSNDCAVMTHAKMRMNDTAVALGHVSSLRAVVFHIGIPAAASSNDHLSCLYCLFEFSFNNHPQSWQVSSNVSLQLLWWIYWLQAHNGLTWKTFFWEI
jgi:hypothetical protein